MAIRKRPRLLTMAFLFVAIVLAALMSRGSAQSPPARPAGTQPPNADSVIVRPNGSLWKPGARALAEDIKAAKVGDTITILVQETSSASSTASTKASRSDKTAFNGLNTFVGPLSRLIKPFDTSNSTSTDGQGQTNRSGSLSTRLTAVVKEVLPNGNLVVEGSREVTVNAEKQKVIIKGTIRPQDIGVGNTVSSVALANATIQYDGKGTVGDKQRKGLLSTVFGWLF